MKRRQESERVVYYMNKQQLNTNIKKFLETVSNYSRLIEDYLDKVNKLGYDYVEDQENCEILISQNDHRLFCVSYEEDKIFLYDTIWKEGINKHFEIIELSIQFFKALDKLIDDEEKDLIKFPVNFKEFLKDNCKKEVPLEVTDVFEKIKNSNNNTYIDFFYNSFVISKDTFPLEVYINADANIIFTDHIKPEHYPNYTYNAVLDCWVEHSDLVNYQAMRLMKIQQNADVFIDNYQPLSVVTPFNSKYTIDDLDKLFDKDFSSKQKKDIILTDCSISPTKGRPIFITTVKEDE